MKKSLLRIILGRTGFTALALITQLLLILIYFKFLMDYSEAVTVLLYFISFGVLLHILNSDENPSYKIAWLLPVAIFPVFGALIFLFFKLQPSVKVINSKLKHNIFKSRKYLKQDKKVLNEYCAQYPAGEGFSRYMDNYAGYPVCGNTDAVYFPLGDEMYPVLLEKLESAKSFIFMEFFIIDRGEMWESIFEILKRKAAEGVEIRLMYDGLCSIAMLPRNYPKTLAQDGIQCRIFNPVRPFLSSSQNNRDHRKICVIDGECGFTGGVNIADEYINRIVRFGHWKDTAVMIEGEAVNNLTMMFLQMWNITDISANDYPKYLAAPEKKTAAGFVLPFGDSPLDKEPVGKEVYLHILNNAKKYVHITTPYLVLDDEMESALIYAAKRGVDVKLILPHKPDKRYVFYLAHAHYPALINAGVRIYEYTPGFMHAKTYVSDDMHAVVGTINMDFRSLYLHWECACYMYGTDCIADIERDFRHTLKQCTAITDADIKSFSIFEKLTGRILKIFAPLM
ncbi:MAG: cardiolipin synthase [Firmicutes bacterium]|nr:cardiolipin synthase [Bacillota bacterium]